MHARLGHQKTYLGALLYDSLCTFIEWVSFTELEIIFKEHGCKPSYPHYIPLSNSLSSQHWYVINWYYKPETLFCYLCCDPHSNLNPDSKISCKHMERNLGKEINYLMVLECTRRENINSWHIRMCLNEKNF